MQNLIFFSFGEYDLVAWVTLDLLIWLCPQCDNHFCKSFESTGFNWDEYDVLAWLTLNIICPIINTMMLMMITMRVFCKVVHNGGWDFVHCWYTDADDTDALMTTTICFCKALHNCGGAFALSACNVILPPGSSSPHPGIDIWETRRGRTVTLQRRCWWWWWWWLHRG